MDSASFFTKTAIDNKSIAKTNGKLGKQGLNGEKLGEYLAKYLPLRLQFAIETALKTPVIMAEITTNKAYIKNYYCIRVNVMVL